MATRKTATRRTTSVSNGGSKTFTQDGMLSAFVELSQTSERGGYISFSKRGVGRRSYVNVFGPSYDPKDARSGLVVIEHNGSISIKDEAIAAALNARPRSRGQTFPKVGNGKWQCSSAELAQAFPSCLEAARFVVNAMAEAGRW